MRGDEQCPGNGDDVWKKLMGRCSESTRESEKSDQQCASNDGMICGDSMCERKRNGKSMCERTRMATTFVRGCG